jgi:hypothetical protein
MARRKTAADGAAVATALIWHQEGKDAGTEPAWGVLCMAARIPRLRYHAVSVVCSSKGCAAARQLKDVRILSLEAPRLPLASCDSPGTCSCTYRHHDDRRAGPRRAREAGGLGSPWAMTDRRRSIGRRETD